VNLVNQRAFAVGLKADKLALQLPRYFGQIADDIIERFRAVNVGLARPEQIAIWSVENCDA
jgi:hypothetical protein